jgi:hypothetical protein
MTKGKMLILRGISGHYDGRNYPRGALDEESAKGYAELRGYEPVVLDVSGEAYANSPQVKRALEYIASHDDVTALYGFSGGGYNVRHILDDLPPKAKAKIELVVVLGALSSLGEQRYRGPWGLVYRNDPPQGHMAGPRVLLAEQERQA